MGTNEYFKENQRKDIMKIIHFVGNLSNLRGLENQAILQMNSLNRRNINSLIWTLSLPKEHSKKSLLYNYYHLVSPDFLKPKIIFANIIIFLRIVFTFEKTVVHIHGLSEYALPFILAKKINKNISIILKISNSGEKSTFKKIRKKFPVFHRIFITMVVKNINQWISINAEIRNELIKEGVKVKQIHSIPNGVILSSNKKSIEFNHSLVWYGALVNHKNLYFLIDIIEKLPNKYTLTIYGKGSIKGDLSKYAAKKGISERVNVAGWVENDKIKDSLHQHTIFVSTSLAEGMSNSLLEALAYNLIPICYDIPANREVLGADYPYLIKDLNANIWSQEIQKIETQQLYLKRILSNRIIKYDIEKITDQLKQVYNC